MKIALATSGASLLAAVALSVALAQTATPDKTTADGVPPLPSEVVERAERRLVQLDVSLKPKRDRDGSFEMPELEAADFELVVAAERVPIVHADRICTTEPSGEATPSTASTPSAAPEVAALPAPRGAYVFYIEHSHLTMQGQEHALKMAEDMIPKLIRGGTRGMVVSSGERWIQSPLSEDPAPLLETIASVRKNTRQWISVEYAETEEARIEEIEKYIREGMIDRARMLILRNQQEETELTSRRLQRLAALLGALADLDPPRAVLYFADIIRKNAGEHYKSLMPISTEDMNSVRQSSFSADFSFDRVTEQSGALGVRLYTVQARGFDVDSVGTNARMQDARDTLQSFALETGGASFLGGSDRKSIDRVLGRIHDDLRCFYLLSFEATGLSEDTVLPVRVRFNADSPRYEELEPAYEVTTRGQIVVQSPTARRESLLLSAHVGENAETEAGARGTMIPLAWRDGAYEALVQLMVANPDLPPELTAGIAWDMGITHEFREEVASQVSGRVEISEPGIPVVLETIWRFKPGSSRVVAVAHESRYGQIASSHHDWEWPDPDSASASISPIAVVQPMRGAFLRKTGDSDATRREGSLSVGDGAALVDRPTYLISLVCRSKRMDGDLWIERRLVGASPVEFGVQRWSPAERGDDERCVQLRDLVAAGQIGWGAFKYEISVFESEDGEGKPLATRELEFAALEPGQDLDALEEGAPAAGPEVRDPLASGGSASTN